MKKKEIKLKLILITATTVGLLIGSMCALLVLLSSGSQSSPYVDDDVSRFEFTEYFIKAGDIGEYSFVYDKYTKVMYAKYSSPGGFSSMTVLFNADGTVMTLDDWNNLKPTTTEHDIKVEEQKGT